MSIIEGGGILTCYRHDFKTTNIDDWNVHCIATGHELKVNTFCIKCGMPMLNQSVPFVPHQPDGSQIILLACDKCKTRGGGS